MEPIRALEEIKEIAGEELMETTYGLFGDCDRVDRLVTVFFNTPKKYFSGQTLYEVCEDNRKSEVESFIKRLEHGVFQ